MPTILGDVLPVPRTLGPSNPWTLFSISGRKVMVLQPGLNDIRHLAPGVYFVRGEGPRSQGSEGPSVRKLVIQR
jgi:hypothetical protein